MESWQSFFVAEVGASAALAGLVFVAVSINLQRILSYPGLPGRALESLVVLLNVLVIASLLLVPGQSDTAIGAEVLAAGIATGIFIYTIQIRSLRDFKREYLGGYIMNTGTSILAVFPYPICGIMVLTQGTASGALYWLVPGVLFSFLLAFLDAWVLLIEINR